jgi:hypothetical protein
MVHTAVNILPLLGHKLIKVCSHGKSFYYTTFKCMVAPSTYLFLWFVFSSYDLCYCLDLSKSSHTTLYYVFNTMLLTLLVFHIYWWVMIYSMIRRQLNNRGKVGEDIRSGKPYILLTSLNYTTPCAVYNIQYQELYYYRGKYILSTSLIDSVILQFFPCKIDN